MDELDFFLPERTTLAERLFPARTTDTDPVRRKRSYSFWTNKIQKATLVPEAIPFVCAPFFFARREYLPLALVLLEVIYFHTLNLQK